MLLWVLNLLFGASEAAAPSPDCYIASQGHIIDTPLSDIAAIGTITDTTAAIGTINDLAVASIGTLTDTNAAQGSLCND